MNNKNIDYLIIAGFLAVLLSSWTNGASISSLEKSINDCGVVRSNQEKAARSSIGQEHRIPNPEGAGSNPVVRTNPVRKPVKDL